MKHLIRFLLTRGILALALLAFLSTVAEASPRRSFYGKPAKFSGGLSVPELTAAQITAQGTPVAGTVFVYTKDTDKKLYIKDSTGTETCLQGDGAEWSSNSTNVLMATADDDLLLDDGTTISFSDGNGSAGTPDVIISRAASGVLSISGAAVGPASVRMLEDTDNGANYIAIVAPSSIGSNLTLTLPAVTDTLVGKTTTDVLTNKTLTAATTSAGTTAAPSLLLTAGTNMTTPSAGAVEFDGVKAMFSPVASARGVIPATQYSIVPAANFTLQTASGVQSCFPTTGDVWTLAATTTYKFEGFYYITKDTNSITTAMAFACSSAPTSILYEAIGQNVAKNTTGTTQQSIYVDTVATTVVTAATTGDVCIKFSGILRTNGATTVTPQVNFSGTASNPVMVTGSYLTFTPIGTNTENILGNVG